MKKLILICLLLAVSVLSANAAQLTLQSVTATDPAAVNYGAALRTKTEQNFTDIGTMMGEIYHQAPTHWVSSGHTYTADIDSVTHGGKTYICTVTHNSSDAGVAGNEPGVGGNWQDVWGVSGDGIFEPAQTVASQAEAEAGTESALRSFSPLRIKQAIDALGGSGSSTLGALTDITGEGTADYMLYDDGDGTFSFRTAPSGTVDLASPGEIGGDTPGPATFTTLTAGSFVSNAADSFHYIEALNTIALSATTATTAGRIGYLADRWWLSDGTNWTNDWLISRGLLEANGYSLITAANYAAMRTLLDLEPGVDFYSKTAADTLLDEKSDLQANLQTDTSGDITITVNAVNYGTDTGDANIPATACDAAEDVGNWVVLITAVADTYSLTSDDTENKFVIAANAAALPADNELDVDGTMVSVMCIAQDLWKVTGYMGAIPTDGGEADQ